MKYNNPGLFFERGKMIGRIKIKSFVTGAASFRSVFGYVFKNWILELLLGGCGLFENGMLLSVI